MSGCGGFSDRQASLPAIPQSSEPDVVHDHIRPGQHQIIPIACVVVRLSSRHVQHLGTTQPGETVGGSSGTNQLGPGRGSTEMISDGRSDTNGKVLVKRVGENLLPTAQTWRLERPGPPERLQAPEAVISTCSATSFHVRPWSRNSRICCVEAG